MHPQRVMSHWSARLRSYRLTSVNLGLLLAFFCKSVKVKRKILPSKFVLLNLSNKIDLMDPI